MVNLFEVFGNFNSGRPAFRALLSKRSRGRIYLTETDLVFQSEVDKIIFQIKLEDIKDYYLVDRFTIKVIEIEDSNENLYTIYGMTKKKESYNSSTRITKDIFENLSRIKLKKGRQIFFESICGYYKNPSIFFKLKPNMNIGFLIITEDFIAFKSFKKDELIRINVMDIIEVEEPKRSSDVVVLNLKDRQKVAFMPLKKRFSNLVRDKKKEVKFIELLNQVVMYKTSEQIRLTELEKQRIKKITDMLDVSTRLKLDMMRIALEMDEKLFTEKLFQWARRFNFVIDGDYLIINPDNVSVFIKDLISYPYAYSYTYKKECPSCGKEVEKILIICPFCGYQFK
jgi:hypothetical protein